MNPRTTRTAARLLSLLIVLACQGETTAPDAVTQIHTPVLSVIDNVVATLTVTPDSQMVFVGDRFKETAKPKNAAGQLLDKVVRWKVGSTTVAKALDSLKATVPFKALKAGTTLITATVDAKSKSAKVVVRSTTGATVVVTPATATVAAGATKQFIATGFTSAGEKAAVNVTWKATGGTISTNGVFKAGNVAGTYQVIATSLFGKADTSAVTVTVPTSQPVDRVLLLPDIAASRPGAMIRFSASLYNSTGAIVTQAVEYRATCGFITSTGEFTAPASGSACSVIASASGKADTTEVVLLVNTNQRTPFGIFALWPTPTTIQTSGVAPFTASHDDASPSGIVNQIAKARSLGIHLIFAMTGGSHDNYKTDGAFDLSKWRARMDGFNTSAIRSAVAAGVADGTIIGNSVMDEPQQSDRDGVSRSKSWGPPGTMTRERVDGLCAYVKNIFPTLPAGVFGDPAVFEPDKPYRVCEFVMAQYGYRKENGNVTRWRDNTLALARRDGLSVVFSLNILNGGKQDRDGVYDCAGDPLMGGLGTYSPNCAMTPAQIREFGRALAPTSCVLVSWRYSATFVNKPQNQAALADVAIAASQLPRKPCTASRGPNTPPVAAFTSSCTDLSCRFTDGSTDANGVVSSWSWNFGDGTTSTERNPIHNYAAAGTYQVELTVTDNNGAPASVTHPVTVSAPPPANQPPTAEFTSDCTDLSCSFDASQSSDVDGSISSYEWDFGDNTANGSGQKPTHTYPAAGTYTVTLTVTDDKGAKGSITHSVSVTPANTAPTAQFTSSCTDFSCSFDATQSSDADGSISSYEWDFGDDTAGSGQQPTHDYAAGGTYTVTLTVTDNKGAKGSVSHQVTVTAANQPPTAAFTSSCTDLACSFTNGSSDQDGSIVSQTWDFGDNTTSTQESPAHAYASAGTYRVTLTVTDNKGATGSVTRQVTVTAPNSAPQAAFTSSCTDLGCTFTDGSTDTDGSISSWEWDFGDNSAEETVQNPTHTYAAAGTYTVTLTVTDNKGATGSVTHQVTVTEPNAPPQAAFTTTCIDLGCDFTDGSTDSDGTIAAYSWTFGDNSDTSNLQNPRHTFAQAGSYDVTLVVTDNNGSTDTVTETVTVSAPETATGAP